MSKPQIDHVFITRFNVPTPGREGLIRAQEGWLKDRIALFERFCAPSMGAQRVQSFHWLIYFDPDSPQWFMDWVQLARQAYKFTAVFRTSVHRDDLVADLRRITDSRGEVLLTTNLDNDDGLSVDFAERLQASIGSATRTAVYLTRGVILRDSRTYLRSDGRNAFCSVAEGWESPVTAWADWHNRLELSMPVKELAGDPAWLQLVHDRNVSNRVHGLLCSPSNYADLFPTALASLPDPALPVVAIENGLLVPARAAKSAVRHATKSLMMQVLGKSGFDAAKNQISAVSAKTRKFISRSKNLPWSQENMESEE
ncbi:glycosyltransferase [Arthrobacter sp. GMC3]|uniref:glycosyltransferase n=1 Tax=Arthrobacter sp. GMC3 TaxID=2058894 RepID=UPI000CE3B211|nr:glycosyltransferase [Arthrobacter sp. GMC3]